MPSAVCTGASATTTTKSPAAPAGHSTGSSASQPDYHARHPSDPTAAVVRHSYAKSGVIRIAGGAVNIRSAQNLAWENKRAKGFNTTDVPLEFCLLSGEIAEAFDAWRKGSPQVAEELADSASFLLSLAEMIGADLQEAVEAKLAANEARVYRRLPNGVLVKDTA